MNSWIDPDFISVNKSKKTVKRKFDSLKSSGDKSKITDVWTKKYSPKILSELVVHKKKISEVQSWFGTALTCRKSQVLIITGPSGCGKTETIKNVAEQLKLDVCEWINPPSLYDASLDGLSDRFFHPHDQVLPENQSQSFKDFILRGSRYPSLCSIGFVRKRFLLIKDFPNFCLSNSSDLHDILRANHKMGVYPVVFVLSDANSGPRSIMNLFPLSVMAELGASHISFNPITTTSMVKVLSNIVSKESIDITKEAIDSIVTLSNGDLRNAINSLQFSCGKADKKIMKPEKCRSTRSSKVKRKPGEQLDQKPVYCDKDQSLFLFRAIGRVLYCKRDEASSASEILPSHLARMERKPLKCDPQNIVDKCPMSGNNFVSFLHQSYLNFFCNCSDIEAASSYLSSCDVLIGDWVTHDTLEEVSTSVAIRGLLFSNNSGTANHTWRPLHKPQLYSVNKTINDRKRQFQYLARRLNYSFEDLVFDVVPFLARLPTKVSGPDVQHMITELGNFSTLSGRGRLVAESISEKDAVIDALESESDLQLIVEENEVVEEIPSDEDYQIEDYDD